MKIKYSRVLALLLFPLSLLAQSSRTATSSTVAGTLRTRATFVYHGELGKWWQNSDVAKKLQLSDGQISQLDQTFYDHKVKLIDYGAEMEKQDLKLQSLLDADVPNEGQVEAQVDQVLTARGKLEREFTMMNLDLRKVLSLDQWRQLKSIRGQSGAFGGGDRIFFRKVLPPGAGPSLMTQPPGEVPVPPLPPLPEDMY
ncbi:MAG: periplasmic heavy metal sensor [Acidobacteriia bacterium]|jgi:Spy/CpxP family protein refolding chaperone|nr:periplasmic heavy metal sensor [Terriglobia bacterium]